MYWKVNGNRQKRFHPLSPLLPEIGLFSNNILMTLVVLVVRKKFANFGSEAAGLW